MVRSRVTVRERMPRELITLQIGQCGNQIGCRFWDLALQEHGRHSRDGLFDESMSTFFRNIDLKTGQEISARQGPRPISSLKARALLVDMEEGVLNEALKGPLGEVFDMRHFLSDVSGSGNNWAHGHEVYGPQYEEELRELIRHPVEECDSLQSFFLMHSLGGDSPL